MHPPCARAPTLRPRCSITNDAAAKAGKLTFRGSAVSHATGPEAHSYQLDLELYGEVDESDIKQVRPTHPLDKDSICFFCLFGT